MSIKPKDFGSGEIPQIIERLEDAGREVPIILVSAKQYEDAQYLVDPSDLAFKVAGAACVYTLPSTVDVFSEVQYLIPRRYQCVNGMVRLYMLGVRLDDNRDSLRHRYYSLWKIEELGEEAVRRQIFRGLARRSNEYNIETVRDLEDVEARRKELSLARMRLAASEAVAKGDVDELKKWIDLLEEVNTTLEGDKKEANQQVDQLKKRIEQLEGEIDQARQETAEKEHLRKQAWRQKDLAEREANVFKETYALLENLDAFPTSLLKAMTFAEQVFPTRLLFLPEARESATDWDFDANRAWFIFRSMATVLHQLYFVENHSYMDKEFMARTGIEIALNEGSQTRNNKRLMKLRNRVYKGRPISLEPPCCASTSTQTVKTKSLS